MNEEAGVLTGGRASNRLFGFTQCLWLSGDGAAGHVRDSLGSRFLVSRLPHRDGRCRCVNLRRMFV